MKNWLLLITLTLLPVVANASGWEYHRSIIGNENLGISEFKHISTGDTKIHFDLHPTPLVITFLAVVLGSITLTSIAFTRKWMRRKE